MSGFTPAAAQSRQIARPPGEGVSDDPLIAPRLKRATALQEESVWLLRSVLDLRRLAALPAASAEAQALREDLAARLAAPGLGRADTAEIATLAARLEREAATLASSCAATLQSLAPLR